MAGIRLQPPDSFDFKSPNEWLRWKRRFQQFRLASGLSGGDQERQVCTLLYSMGDEAEDILCSTNISADKRKVYNTVLEKFDKFFKVRKNITFERARFNRRSQGDSESSEQFITDLYRLAEDCEYGNLTDQMIRDRIVVGIRDRALSEKLQMDPDLTLEKAKMQVRQREAIHEQEQILKQPVETSVAAVHHKTTYKGNPSHGRKPQYSKKPAAPTPTKCTHCGREAHKRQQCPARDATCHKCNKKGHFGSQCFSKIGKRVGDITSADQGGQDFAYLSTLGGHSSECLCIPISINGIVVDFKVDTGAEVTAITGATYNLISTPTLDNPSKSLRGPDRKPLSTLGMIEARLSHEDRYCRQPVYVIQDLEQNLLGLPALRELEILSFLQEINIPQEDIISSYPKVFQGLGTLQGDFHIHLKNDATPFALHTPCNVPLPMRPKVKAELERMESLGVISKVDEPTPWCAGMVAVPKPDGSVRICVDLRPLNASVLREVHPLPTVDNILAQLSGARVFSKLDANSGFWQIPLDEESRPLITFITPYGRFCFNKMPFGISSAPEHFQKRMSNILEGQAGVLCLIDDIIIYGRTQEEHDKHLQATLKCIQKAGVTLNKEKCKFNCTSIRFLGHVVSANGVSPDPSKVEAILKMPPHTTITEVRRFMGMVNQLGKFTPRIAELSQPLRELLTKNSIWTWGPSQAKAFQSIKEVLTQPHILAWYEPNAETKVSADASAYGLGAILRTAKEP